MIWADARKEASWTNAGENKRVSRSNWINSSGASAVLWNAANQQDPKAGKTPISLE